ANAAAGTRYAIRACKFEPRHCETGGERFELGRGAPRDLERARTFFDEGCRHGHEGSCRSLERIGGAPEPPPTRRPPPPPADAG
ncbi:hypothetical protein OVW21_26995, partial [Klebsiella pneumoniae]|nr:hypothetical protein [Klebsiella pneumoniae]